MRSTRTARTGALQAADRRQATATRDHRAPYREPTRRSSHTSEPSEPLEEPERGERTDGVERDALHFFLRPGLHHQRRGRRDIGHGGARFVRNLNDARVLGMVGDARPIERRVDLHLPRVHHDAPFPRTNLLPPAGRRRLLARPVVALRLLELLLVLRRELRPVDRQRDLVDLAVKANGTW